MSFSDWKKRSKRYHDMMAGHGIGRAVAEEVARAAYKAGERDGRKQVNAVAENGARLAVLVEREACAEFAEGATAYTKFQTVEHYKLAAFIAAAIRERSNAKHEGPPALSAVPLDAPVGR